ncbi:hypothetical protein [Collimonas sp.]|uniref:hypothetical protein n=1 Tax=Collimonas sp. TaxID=1963772 RepID=UPI0037BEAFC8
MLMIFKTHTGGRMRVLAYAALALLVGACGKKAETLPLKDERRLHSTEFSAASETSGDSTVLYLEAERKRAKAQATNLLIEMKRAERLSYDLKIMHNKVRYYREFNNPLENLLQNWSSAHDSGYPLHVNLENCRLAAHKILAVGKSIKKNEIQKKHLFHERTAYVDLMLECERGIRKMS